MPGHGEWHSFLRRLLTVEQQRQGSLPEGPRPLGLGALALEPVCRHVRCHHKNEAIVKKGQNNINVLGANE